MKLRLKSSGKEYPAELLINPIVDLSGAHEEVLEGRYWWINLGGRHGKIVPEHDNRFEVV